MTTVTYKTSTGQIVGFMSDDELQSVPSGFASLITNVEIGHSMDAFIVTGSPLSVQAKQAMSCILDKSAITANGADKATVSNIPNGAEVTVIDENGRSVYVVTDGFIEIQAAEAQAIQVRVALFPWRDFLATVTAT